MKKIFYILTVLFSSLFIVSCEDDSKDKFEFGAPNGRDGSFVVIDITNPVIDGTNITGSAFEFTLDAPSNNVAAHDIMVRRTPLGGLTSQYFHLRTVTTFPSTQSVTAQDLATAVGIDVSEVDLGDTYEFICESTGTDGSVVNINTASQDLISEAGQRAAYQFVTFVVCPLPSTYFTGAYDYVPFDIGAGFGPVFGNQTDGDGNQVVFTLAEKNVFQRTFDANYLAHLAIGQPDMTFELTFICGEVQPSNNQSTFLGCGGSIFLGSAGVTLYNDGAFDDDNELFINIDEGLLGGQCAGSNNTQIVQIIKQ